jgi:hypothetical protein
MENNLKLRFVVVGWGGHCGRLFFSGKIFFGENGDTKPKFHFFKV